MSDFLPRYTVTDLGILPGFEASRATGLNDRGQVIGSLSREDMDADPHGFLWTEGTMHDLGRVWLESINSKGQVVGTKGRLVGGNHQLGFELSATLYTAGRFADLLKNTSAAVSMAKCINDCGQVVGMAQSIKWKTPPKSKRGCFMWENGKRHYLDIPEGYHAGDAVAINNARQVVGKLWEHVPNEHHGVLTRYHAVFWSDGVQTLFEEPPGFTESEAVAINNHGQIVVRAYYSNFQEMLQSLNEEKEGGSWGDAAGNQERNDSYQRKLAALPEDAFVSRQRSFLWQNGEMTAVDGLAEAVNDQGQVVGWSGCQLSAEELAKGRKAASAFLWQKGELIDLNDRLPADSGWQLTKANDINNNGQIVGHGELHGNTRAFLLTPIPS